MTSLLIDQNILHVLPMNSPLPRMAHAIASTLQDLHSRGLSLEDTFVAIEPGRYRVRTA